MLRDVHADFYDACGECLQGPEDSDKTMNQMLEFKRKVDAGEQVD